MIFVVQEGNEEHKNPSYRITDKHKGKFETSLELLAPNASSTAIPFGTDALCKTSFRQQLVNTFLLKDSMGSESQGRGLMHWLSFVPSLPSPLCVLETSIYALCTARLGQMQSDQILINESVRLYVKGLRELQVALRNPELVYKDETLGACLALSVYEVVQGDRFSYVNHVDGASKLIKLRRPSAYSSGLSHKIFLAYRFIGVSHLVSQTSLLIVPTLTGVGTASNGKKRDLVFE